MSRDAFRKKPLYKLRKQTLAGPDRDRANFPLPQSAVGVWQGAEEAETVKEIDAAMAELENLAKKLRLTPQ